MNTLDRVRSLNQCADVGSLWAVFRQLCGAGEGIALYRIDTTAPLFRLLGHEGMVPPPDLVRLDNEGTLAPLVSIPLPGSAGTAGLAAVQSKRSAEIVMALAADLGTTLERVMHREAATWRCEILDHLGALSRNGMIVATPNGDTVLYGSRLEELVGWTEDDVRTHGWTNLVYPDPAYRQELLKGLAALMHGEASPGIVRHLTCKDGKTRDFAVWSALGPKIPGGPPALLGIIEDVAEQAKLRERAAKSAGMAQLGRLAGGIAHDVNNLLCAIMGHTELLGLVLTDNPAAQQRVETILEACGRGAISTRQLLVFGGAAVTKLVPLSMDKEVANAVAMFRPELGGQVEVEIAVAAPSPIVQADPGRLTMALGNLLKNAAEAMQGRGRIRVSVREAEVPTQLDHRAEGCPEPGSMAARIRIHDSGPGFSNDARAHLLEPFFSTKNTGHGLGLCSIAGVLDSHGGGLRVGHRDGAVVDLYLPLSDQPELKISQLTAAEDGQGRVVWLVDDDPHIREFSVLALISAGYQVRSCESGAAALDGEHDSPELLVLDVTGPMSGPELLIQLRARGLTAPVLWISGYVFDTGTIAEPHEASVFLQKPFTASQLVTTVGEVLRSS